MSRKNSEHNNSSQSAGIDSEWSLLLDEYERRLQAGRAMGGKEKLARRKRSRRLNARQVIEALVDTDSFMELGTLAGSMSYGSSPAAPADALVGGLARINGRNVVLAVEDFTVLGGSIGHATAAKRLRLAKLAEQQKIPYLLLLDGAGARATNALERHPYSPNDLQILAKLSGQVPTIAVVLGTAAGHAALSGVLMDFVVMLNTATLFSAGPPLVAAAVGEIVSKEELGSARMHASQSGVAHNLVKDEYEACELIKTYLSFMPQNAWQRPARREAAITTTLPPRNDDILSLIPRQLRKPYNIKPVIRLLCDPDSILEIQPDFGTAIVTALATINGHVIGIVANQPTVMAGSIDHKAADKAAHFLGIADAFHIPVLFLADNPGIMSGRQAEQAGTLRAAARMYMAQANLRSAKFHVTLRKAFGFGSSLMAMNPFDQQTLSLALPGISLGGMPASSGANAAKLDEATQAQITEAETSGAWTAGDNMAYDEVVDPRDLRTVLLRALDLNAERSALAAEPASHCHIRP